MQIYTLDAEGNPILCEDAVAWGEWMRDEAARRVALDEDDSLAVSTVFLGMDHSWGGGPPVLWETMVFRDGEEVDVQRHSSLVDAQDGHKEMVAKWLPAKERGAVL
jgi:hypothetical protein